MVKIWEPEAIFREKKKGLVHFIRWLFNQGSESTCPVYIADGLSSPIERIPDLISPVNTYEWRVGARLLDFFSSRSLWNRSLWSAGIVLVLKEIVEASVGQRDGHLGPDTIREVMGTAARLAEHDPGVGDKVFRNTLRGVLLPGGAPRKDHRDTGVDYAARQQMGNTINNHYLARWPDALVGANRPGAERAAR